MTWIHWILFTLLCLLTIGVALDRAAKVGMRLFTFVLFVGMILLLILGQPK